MFNGPIYGTRIINICLKSNSQHSRTPFPKSYHQPPNPRRCAARTPMVRLPSVPPATPPPTPPTPAHPPAMYPFRSGGRAFSGGLRLATFGQVADKHRRHLPSVAQAAHWQAAQILRARGRAQPKPARAPPLHPAGGHSHPRPPIIRARVAARTQTLRALRGAQPSHSGGQPPATPVRAPARPRQKRGPDVQTFVGQTYPPLRTYIDSLEQVCKNRIG
jgi:hypothetical protein